MIRKCRKCGVPMVAGKAHAWKDNGMIVQRRNPDNRMIFMETENMEDLFKGIEDIIGAPIAHLVIESIRREARKYLESELPLPAGKLGRRMFLNMAIRKSIDIGTGMGIGHIEPSERRLRFDDGDYYSEIIQFPRSITMFAGEGLAAFEAITRHDGTVAYEKIAANTFRLTIRAGEHPLELQGYFAKAPHPEKPGDIKWRRCERCGTPLDIATCRWDYETGCIFLPDSGNRVSIYSPTPIEAVFKDLEAELGVEIPEAIIEAQRRHISRSMVLAEAKSIDEYRYALALRGLGYISRLHIGVDHVAVTIQNPCLYPLLVGTVKGIFAYVGSGGGSTHQWSVDGGGDLYIEIEAVA